MRSDNRTTTRNFGHCTSIDMLWTLCNTLQANRTTYFNWVLEKKTTLVWSDRWLYFMIYENIYLSGCDNFSMEWWQLIIELKLIFEPLLRKQVTQFQIIVVVKLHPGGCHAWHTCRLGDTKNEITWRPIINIRGKDTAHDVLYLPHPNWLQYFVLCMPWLLASYCGLAIC